jgi:glycosyltransferase involved in cell wall biosynthesis
VLNFKVFYKKCGAWLRNRIKNKPTRIYNLFNTKYKKKALLSYITHPFYRKGIADITHTNILEARAWADELNSRGYIVDVFDCMDTGPIENISQYELICGFGFPFETASSLATRKNSIFIVYGTGCHSSFSNIETIRSKIEFYNRYNIWPTLGGREVCFSWPIQNRISDYYIILGNDFVAETFRKNIEAGNIFNIQSFFIEGKKDHQWTKNKNFKENILWFGSTGALHKGLVNTLEAIRSIPNVTLHVAGLNNEERIALNLDALFIDIKDRIVFHDFVRVNSEHFSKLMSICGIVVFPSMSEGGSPSVLTAVSHFAGIPIVTKACGLDFENIGIVIEDSSINKIETSIKTILSMPTDKHLNALYAAADFVQYNYTYTNYKKELKKVLGIICDNTNMSKTENDAE